jgi:hypothetical protein
MKRILITISSVFIICLIPFSFINAQEKKTEKKIKIIVSDDSGTKVIVDTLIIDGSMNDSIKLKNGEVIYLNNSGDEKIVKPLGKAERIFVTVSSDGKENQKEANEFTVIYSDSSDMSENGEHSKIYVISDDINSGDTKNVHYKVVSKSLKNSEGNDRIIYFNDSKSSDKEMDKKFDVYSDSDEESGVEKTRYVIAKDGMVVTVESSDEARAKELIKEIEKKLGVNDEGSEKKVTVKSETKKNSKK